MKGSILNGKLVLAVDDEPEVLNLLEEKISAACPGCRLDKATTYQEAAAKIGSSTYDLVLLDIMGVRGFDLLDLAVARNVPAAMLATYPPNPGALKRSIEMGARGYLLKVKLEEIVPILEDVLSSEFLPGWRHVLGKMREQIEYGDLSGELFSLPETHEEGGGSKRKVQDSKAKKQEV